MMVTPQRTRGRCPRSIARRRCGTIWLHRGEDKKTPQARRPRARMSWTPVPQGWFPTRRLHERTTRARRQAPMSCAAAAPSIRFGDHGTPRFRRGLRCPALGIGRARPSQSRQIARALNTMSRGRPHPSHVLWRVRRGARMRHLQREVPHLDHGGLSFSRQALEGVFRSQGLAFTRERPGRDQRDGAVRSRITPPATSVVSGHAPLDMRGIAHIQGAIGAAGHIYVVRFWPVSLVHTSPPELHLKWTSSTENGAFQRSRDGSLLCPEPWAQKAPMFLDFASTGRSPTLETSMPLLKCLLVSLLPDVLLPGIAPCLST